MICTGRESVGIKAAYYLRYPYSVVQKQYPPVRPPSFAYLPSRQTIALTILFSRSSPLARVATSGSLKKSHTLLSRAIPGARALGRMANTFLQYLRGEQRAPGERKLVQKLDFFILTFCCLMYFVNYLGMYRVLVSKSAPSNNCLDRTNLNNAYVSGMKEELHFKGNQLNQINTVFTVGYTIAQVPCALALTYFKPRYFFPACMVRLALLSYFFCTDFA